MVNEALFSSKNMNWCTPPDFFKELDREFHFDLDAAATDKSAKCRNYFAPADDGLSKNWGGTPCSVIPHMGELFGIGYKKAMKRAGSRVQSWSC
jgi:hypothetical protein